MNLVTEYLENSMEIKSKTINTLVIEDTKQFASFVRGLWEATNKESEKFEKSRFRKLNSKYNR